MPPKFRQADDALDGTKYDYGPVRYSSHNTTYKIGKIGVLVVTQYHKIITVHVIASMRENNITHQVEQNSAHAWQGP